MSDPKVSPAAPATRPHVEDYQAPSAELFLQALSPMNDTWARESAAWIYRGQANADWELKATAVREKEAFKEFGFDGDSSHWSSRVAVLELMLARFRYGLDETGLVIPAKSPRILSHEFSETSSNADPAREAWPLMALAQHHGLPTPLLDWSRRASVAAYFAASSALAPENRGKATHLAVWCLNTGDHTGHAHDMARPNSGHLQVYLAPGGTNPNLRAQAGVFTYLWGANDPSVEAYVANRHAEKLPAPKLHRVTLPVTDAGKLLRLLSHDGIHGTSMFPGADGVVRAMREEALWDKPPAGLTGR
jgi:hypothetical protein